MSPTQCCVATLTVMTVLCACQGGDDQTAQQTHAEEKARVTAEQVKREAQEALTAAQQYAQQQREVYQRQMQRQLEELTAQIEAWKQQAPQTGKDKREDLQEIQHEVEQKLAVARKQLADLQTARVEIWEEMKTAVDTAMQELQKSSRYPGPSQVTRPRLPAYSAAAIFSLPAASPGEPH